MAELTLLDFRRQVGKNNMKWNAAGDEQTLLDQWANEGVLDILRRTKINRRHITVTFTAAAAWGQAGDYDLSSLISAADGGIKPLAILDVTNITDPSGTFFYKQVSPDEILQARRSAAATAGGAGMYAWDGDLLMTWPTPGATVTAYVSYVPYPTTGLVNTTDTPATRTLGGIPQGFHTAWILYGQWRAAIYNDKTQGGSPDELERRYMRELMSARADVRPQGRKLARAVPGYAARFPRREDVYP